MEGEILTTGPAARLLDCCETQVRNFAASGRLPSIRTVNGQRFFQRKDVERLAAELAAKVSPDKRGDNSRPAA